MEQQQPPGPNRRLMQVKVLYTFVDDPKSNCLARCPAPLNIQTAFLDPSTEIGVIELRTCIQAIAAASPELVAKLGQDYTVYAYDYSEYETPLVGQGMLSYILAAASSTPTAPAHQSRTLVTGRVSKNAFALFSSGAAEVLEVKLKLIPVPCDLQKVYLENMEKYRSPSTLNAANVQSADAAAWQSLLGHSPDSGTNTLPTPSPVLAMSDPRHFQYPSNPPPPHDRRGSISQPAPQSGRFSPTHHTLNLDNAPPPQQPQHWESRPRTPLEKSSEMVAASRKRPNPPSRPSSRASNAGGRRPALNKAQSCASRVEGTANTSDAEDGPRPKRARVTQTDWNGSSNFGAVGDSLRVTAAAAASIRGHRPYAGNFLTSDIAAESGERPPTPRPSKISRPVPKRQSMTALSFSRESTRNSNTPPPVNTTLFNHDPLGILADSSPEKRDDSSIGSSPMDLPSSPPVMHTMSPSPRRPSNLSRFEDSGFASGNLDEYLQDMDNFKMDNEDYTQPHAPMMSEPPSQDTMPVSRPIAPERRRVEPETLGVKIAPAPPGYVPPSSPAIAPKKRTVRSRASSMSRPPVKAKSTLAVDQTEALLSAALSDDPRMRSESCLTDAGSVLGENNPPLQRSKSQVLHERKKQMIQDKLAQSVLAGELPRFCRHCGEINTPSWRKAFVKIVNGSPGDLPRADPEKKTPGWEQVETDAEGNVTVYQFTKLTLDTGEEGYEEIDLCNPCGLWMARNNVMRPMEAWQAKVPKPRQRSYAPKKKKQKSATDPVGSSDPMQSDGGPMESIERDNESASPPDASAAGQTTKPASVKRQQRASSAGPTNQPVKKEMAASQAALQRAIQSSPPRFPGSKHSPIELDILSPEKPLNRLLFPSPRKPGEVKSLDPDADKQMESQSLDKQKAHEGHTFDCWEDKENEHVADGVLDDGFDQIFNLTAATNDFATPTKRETQLADLFKTPTRSVRRTPLGTKDFMGSAGHKRSRSNPTTPSRAMTQSVLPSPSQMTPWTAQLYNMFSEANNSDASNPWPGMEDVGGFNFSDFSTGDHHGGGFDAFNDEVAGGIWDQDIESFLGGHAQEQEQGQSPKGTMEGGSAAA